MREENLEVEPLENEQVVHLGFYDADQVNNVEKRRVIKAFMRIQKVNLICLQETKLKRTSHGLIRSLRVGRFVEWVASNAVGAVDGILIFWDS